MASRHLAQSTRASDGMSRDSANKGKSRSRALISQSTPGLFIREDKLQGVVLADSFNMRFKPITLERPRALLPLAGSPLIDYTLEFLIAAGITDIVVFCCSHAEQIVEHLSQRWSAGRADGASGATITPVMGADSESAGDALRKLYDDGYIRGDFVLVTGDVVSNTKLKQAIADHRRRKKDSRYVMTSIFKRAGPSHRTRAGEDDTVLAIDPQTSQLLYYENNRSQRVLKVERSLFLDHPTVQFRYDLLDCQIDICTPTVLDLFKEQFDFRHPRRDFLASLLNKGTEENPQFHRVYCHIIDAEYAARVRDLYTYGAVTRDIVRRWAYPIVPDNNIVDPGSAYTYSRGNVYLEEGVALARSAQIEQNTIVGAGTQIESSARISGSVIGRNCIIGRNVQLHNAFVWDNVVVGEGCRVADSLLCTGVRLAANVVVEPGAVVSFNVAVEPGVVVPRETKLCLHADGDATSPFAAQPSLFVWSIDDAGVELELSGARLTNKAGGLNPNSLIYCPFDTESDLSDSDDDAAAEAEQDEETSNFEKFEANIKELTKQFVEKPGSSVEGILVQIKAEKFASDRTWIDCAQVFLPTMLALYAGQHGAEPIVVLKEKVLAAISKVKPILQVLCRDGDGEDDQVEVILMVQEFCERPAGEPLRPLFPLVLHRLYMEELVDKDAIDEWAGEQAQNTEKISKDLFASCREFLDWLNESSDEDDEEESDVDDDDD